jgi:uncharacterized protein YcbX
MFEAIGSVFGFSSAPDDVVVSEIFAYPIKSCRGIRLESSPLSTRGLKYDRMFALMNNKGVHISLRCHPKMATITTAFSSCGTKLLVECASMSSGIEVPLEELPGEKTYETLHIWDSPCDVFEVDVAFSQWFCEALKIKETKFVRLAEHFVRETSRKTSPSGQHALADQFPYLLVSEKSLDAVNALLEVPITMENFRPNIVVKNCEAFAEDTWQQVVLGGITMSVTQRCSRCVLPNTHPITGIRDNKLSVSKALRNFRTGQHLGVEGDEDMQEATFWGVHLDNHNAGDSDNIVSVGDVVTILPK